MTTTSQVAQRDVLATLHPALGARFEARRPNAWSATMAFGWRSLLKIKHLPEQMADVIAIPIVFTLMFTYLFGGALAGSPSTYIQYLLPGTLVMTVLLVTINTGIGLNTDISSGLYDRFRSMSHWRLASIAGGFAGDALRYVTASTLVLLVGLLLGFRPAGGVVGTLLAVGLILVFAFSLSWVWSVVGLLMRSPAAVTSVGTVVLFPLTIASNVFVNPHTMPSWLQAIINVNPATHLVTAVRALMHGSATAGQISWVLIASVALTVVFAPLTLYLYRNVR